jgi:hypothetical protein
MSKASPGTTARMKDKGNRMPAVETLASTKALQRLYRKFDRASLTIPFRPTDSMLYPDPNQWRPADLKD